MFDQATGQVIIAEEIPEGVSPEEFLEQVMHDCPECQAARAAGEQPVIIKPPKPRRFARRPRWRTMKRRS